MPHLIDEQQIRDAIDAAGLSYVQDLNPRVGSQLSIWLTRLLSAPRNLTAIREPNEAIQKHLIEPLAGRHRLIGADLPVPHGPMIDIGSGNGAPGLPLALCEPERQATLLDSRAGAAAFLREVVVEIGASQISVLQERAEIAAHEELREQFAVAVSRAAATPAAAMELMVPYLQIGGVAAAWTGELSETDTASVTSILEILGAELTPIDPPRDIIVATKIRATDSRYPRPWSQIRRRPLSESQARVRHSTDKRADCPVPW